MKKTFILLTVFLVSAFFNTTNDLSAIESEGDKKTEKKVITACDGETQVVLNDVAKDEVMSREKSRSCSNAYGNISTAKEISVNEIYKERFIDLG